MEVNIVYLFIYRKNIYMWEQNKRRHSLTTLWGNQLVHGVLSLQFHFLNWGQSTSMKERLMLFILSEVLGLLALLFGAVSMQNIGKVNHRKEFVGITSTGNQREMYVRSKGPCNSSLCLPPNFLPLYLMSEASASWCGIPFGIVWICFIVVGQ